MATNPKSRSCSRRSAGVLLLVGVLVGVTVGGGVGVLAASSTKPVTVCADKKTNVLRYAKNGKCAKTETIVLLNQTGIDGANGLNGAVGDTGAKGDTGATGATGAKGVDGSNGTNGANTNSQIKSICGDNGTTACRTGLKGPGGGFVFMTPATLGNTSGQFYEVAPSTWSSSAGDPTSQWCESTTTQLGVFVSQLSRAMDGAAKTAVILGSCGSGAAALADEFVATVNGVEYADWFLPAMGQLYEMSFFRNEIGGFASGAYWSSCENDATRALTLALGTRISASKEKSTNNYVRPIRAF